MVLTKFSSDDNLVRVKIARNLIPAVQGLALDRHKMAFISGPRQVGKTTLAKSIGQGFDQFHYFNWDEIEFRRLWTKSPNDVMQKFDETILNSKKFILFDEIHKSKGWKQKLKGLFDLHGEEAFIVVTGSARLNHFKKGGDSLMGRYFNFRLHPLSLGEVLKRNTVLQPDQWRNQLFKKPQKIVGIESLDQLLQFSGFPEPFLSRSEQILRVWRKGRTEKLIREDLRDLSRISELSQIEMLASLLPQKVGSPLSVQSLREDLEVAHTTVSRWLMYLKELFYHFEIKPWSKSVARSLKKEGKIYLYDWTEIEDPGLRFENLVASHLLKACHFWTDTGEGQFDLCYLRNKEKQEVDFLIAKNHKPWLALEAKLTDTKMNESAIAKLVKPLRCPYVQIVHKDQTWLARQENLIASANYVLTGLP